MDETPTLVGLGKSKEKTRVIVEKMGLNDMEAFMKLLNEMEYKIFNVLLESPHALNRREIQLKIKGKSWHKVDRALRRLEEQKIVFSRPGSKKEKLVWFVNPYLYGLWKRNIKD